MVRSIIRHRLSACRNSCIIVCLRKWYI